MKNFYLLFIGLFVAVATGQAQSITSGNAQTVYPGLPCLYSFSITGTINKWVVKGGFFSASNPNDTVINRAESSVVVYWTNVKGSRNQIPTGKLTVYYKINDVPDSVSYEQKIYSLNGVSVPDLHLSPSSETFIGKDTVYVSMYEEVNYAGMHGPPYPSPSYKWMLPEGWKTTSGKSGTFYEKTTSLSVITDGFGTQKVRFQAVNEQYAKDTTAIKSVDVEKTKVFTRYPAGNAIKYGYESNFTYTVPASSTHQYEWSLPEGWEIVSGANTNSVVVKKKMCATSADVKVRMVSSKETSSWFTCPTDTVTAPAVQISGGRILKTIPFEISIDIPEENVEMFNVTANNLQLDDFVDANTRQCRFTEAGEITLQISVKLKAPDCKTYSFYKTVTVEDFSASNVEIMGPDAVCNDVLVTYTLFPEFPDNTSVNWTIEGDGAFVYSGQGTPTIQIGSSSSFEQSDVTLVATLYGFSVEKEIHIGATAVSSIEGSSDLQINMMGIPSVSSTYTALPAVPEGTADYAWSIEPESYGATITFVYGNTATVEFTQSGNYTLSCRLINTTSGCGDQLIPVTKQITVTQRWMRLSYANRVATVSLSESSAEQETKTLNYEIRSLSTGILIKKGVLRGVSKSADIDLDELQPGLYLLNVSSPDGYSETLKFTL